MARLARRFLVTRFLLVVLVLFVLFQSSSSGIVGAHSQKQLATSVALASSFAISDFDGDLHPDLANVQFEQIDGSYTDYWIQFHLTTSGWQSIRLVAPPGGLLIEARDVNGDDAPDLVVATTSVRRPVAIFLNDRRGGFSQVAPAAFPEAFNDSPAKLASDSAQSNQAVGTSPQSSFKSCLEAKGVSGLRPPADWVSVSNLSFLVHSFLILHAGRAPPLS